MAEDTKSTLDAETMAAITAALVTKVRADEPGAQERLDRAFVAHVWQGDGLYEVRQSPLMRVVTQLAELKGEQTPGLPNLVRKGLTLRVPRLPAASLAQVVSFFGAVYEAHKSECIIQVFWDEVAQTHILSVPPQNVSGAHVDHQGPVAEVAHLLHVMDIHSHGSMGAFWSSTDDRDEKRFPLRLFGVIGKFGAKGTIPEWRWRVWTGRAFEDLSVDQVFDLSAPWTVRVTLGDVLKGHIDIQTVPEALKVEVPPAWLAAVDDKPVRAISGWRGQQDRETPTNGESYAAWRGYDRSDYSLWDRGPHERQHPRFYPPPDPWAIKEGVTKDEWEELCDACGEWSYQPYKAGSRAPRKPTRRQARTVRKAREAALADTKSDAPPQTDGRVIGSMTYHGGKWWRKTHEGWVVDEYDPHVESD